MRVAVVLVPVPPEEVALRTTDWGELGVKEVMTREPLPVEGVVAVNERLQVPPALRMPMQLFAAILNVAFVAPLMVAEVMVTGPLLELVTLNVTVPCGMPVPDTLEVTVAVKVTEVLEFAVLGPVTLVVVAVAPTLTGILVLTAELNCVSPP